MCIAHLRRSPGRTKRTTKLTRVQEIDELVDNWVPEPIAKPLTNLEAAELAAILVVAGPNGPHPVLINIGKPAINLDSLNFTGLAGNEHIEQTGTTFYSTFGKSLEYIDSKLTFRRCPFQMRTRHCQIPRNRRLHFLSSRFLYHLLCHSSILQMRRHHCR
jgi:hypothetical protein